MKDQTTRGYPKHPNWPKEHYRVATIQADGKFHIELGYSAGDKQDFWTQNMTLKSGGTFPNTDSYQGGILKATGIEITVISRNQFIMSFTIKGLGGSNQRSRTPTVATKDVAVDDRSTGGPNRDIDSHKTGGSIAWLLSMLGAVAAMLGLLVLFL